MKRNFTDPAPAATDAAGRISAAVNSPGFRARRILGGGSSTLPVVDAPDGKKVGPRCFRFTPNRDARVVRIMDALGVDNRTVVIEAAIDVLAEKLGID